MTKTQMITTQTTLQHRLQTFGLDPKEWTLEPRGNGQAVVRHRRRRALSLSGTYALQAGILDWTSLQLRSI